MSPTADEQGASKRLSDDMDAWAASIGIEVSDEKKAIRTLARKLLGPRPASMDRGVYNRLVDNKRGQVRKWRTKGRYLSRVNAESVAAVLGTDPARYMEPPPNPVDLLEKRLAKNEEENRLIREELAKQGARSAAPRSPARKR